MANTYVFQLQPNAAGSWPPLFEVHADSLSEDSYNHIYVLTRDDKEVARITSPLAAWWIRASTRA